MGCSKGFVKRIIEAEEVVTPLKCRKYFVNMQRCTIFTIFSAFFSILFPPQFKFPSQKSSKIFFIVKFALFRFLDAYQAGASGLDVVAKTRELKKRHRAPHVMPDDQRKGTYRRMRRVRGGGAEQAGQEKEEEEEQVGQEGEEQEQEQGEPQEELEESLKGAVWKLVRDYIRHKTRGDPCECQHFFFDDLMSGPKKTDNSKELTQSIFTISWADVEICFQKTATTYLLNKSVPVQQPQNFCVRQMLVKRTHRRILKQAYMHVCVSKGSSQSMF